MLINKIFIRYNYSSRKGEKMKYIVINNTGNKDKGAVSNNHYYKYF